MCQGNLMNSQSKICYNEINVLLYNSWICDNQKICYRISIVRTYFPKLLPY